MHKKPLMVIVSSVVAGILAVVLMNVYIRNREKNLFKGMEVVTAVVASKSLPAGTKLTMDLVARRDIPKQFLHGNAVEPKDADMIEGQVLTFPLKKGDPLLWTDLQESGAASLSGLAGKVTKGERALSVAVDSVAGVTGLLKPNDHIDFLCTVRGGGDGQESTFVLLQNLTIIATGDQMSGARTKGGYGTLTLLVTLNEAELLTFASTKGKLTAILRNPEDIDTSAYIPPVNFADITRNEYRQQVQQERNRIEVIKQGRVTK